MADNSLHHIAPTDEQIEQVKANQDALYRDVMELSDKAIKKLIQKKTPPKGNPPRENS